MHGWGMFATEDIGELCCAALRCAAREHAILVFIPQHCTHVCSAPALRCIARFYTTHTCLQQKLICDALLQSALTGNVGVSRASTSPYFTCVRFTPAAESNQFVIEYCGELIPQWLAGGRGVHGIGVHVMWRALLWLAALRGGLLAVMPLPCITLQKLTKLESCRYQALNSRCNPTMHKSQSTQLCTTHDMHIPGVQTCHAQSTKTLAHWHWARPPPWGADLPHITNYTCSRTDIEPPPQKKQNPPHPPHPTPPGCRPAGAAVLGAARRVLHVPLQPGEHPLGHRRHLQGTISRNNAYHA